MSIQICIIISKLTNFPVEHVKIKLYSLQFCPGVPSHVAVTTSYKYSENINIPMPIQYRPARSKVYELADAITAFLFQFEWNYESILLLFDIISKDNRAPNPFKISYGNAIYGMNNVRNKFYHIGVRGSQPRLQTKQAITCAVMKIDDNGFANKRSKQLLSELLPHQNKDCRNDWIK